MVGRADYDVIKSQCSSDNRDALLNGHPDEAVGDEELDELLAQIASIPEEEGRAAASAAAQARLAEQADVLPLVGEPQVFGFIAAEPGCAPATSGRRSFYENQLA